LNIPEQLPFLAQLKILRGLATTSFRTRIKVLIPLRPPR
jgi:hypothetical protein